MAQKTVLYSVITRLEISKLKGIIKDFDEDAFVTISDVYDIMGGKHRRKRYIERFACASDDACRQNPYG